MQIPADKKLKVGEVAQLLGISPDSVRRLADGGAFVTVRYGPGAQRLITASSVEAYLVANGAA